MAIGERVTLQQTIGYFLYHVDREIWRDRTLKPIKLVCRELGLNQKRR